MCRDFEGVTWGRRWSWANQRTRQRYAVMVEMQNTGTPVAGTTLRHGIPPSPLDQLDLQVRREVQQLLARKFLAHSNLAVQVEPNQMKY